jgi:methylthioribose-1-phosphate isomerase
MVIVGADRIARNGDVANKIGTLSVANNAQEYGIPFYVAAPTSTFDLDCETGDGIKIEERDGDEVRYQTGLHESGKLEKVLVCNPGSEALNFAFDVTGAELIAGMITERGIIKANERDIKELFQ